MQHVYTPFSGAITPDNIAEVLAHHKRTFAGVRMETEVKEPEAKEPEAKEPEAKEPEGKGAQEPEKKPDAPAMSLEDALEEVTKTRGEAANYRVRAREAEEALAKAKTLDEVNEIVAKMTSDREVSERALLVENVALKHSLPEALAARLQGATREELEADAKVLAELIPEEPVGSLRGGLDPDGGEDEPSDPRALARKYNRRGPR